MPEWCACSDSFPSSCKTLAAGKTKIGFSEDVVWLYKAVPAFEGQQPMAKDIWTFKGDQPLAAFYCHAKVDVKRGMSSGG